MQPRWRADCVEFPQSLHWLNRAGAVVTCEERIVFFWSVGRGEMARNKSSEHNTIAAMTMMPILIGYVGSRFSRPNLPDSW